MKRKTYFNEQADSWDETFQNTKLLSFLERLVPHFNLKTGQYILDVGTGTGVLIPYLAKAVGLNGSVTAIDYSEKMIQICKTKYSPIKNVTIELKNIEETTFLKKSFDAVICFGVFPHLEKREKALCNINSVLKPGGKLIIAHALSSEELKVHHNSASSAVLHDVLPEEAEMKQLLEYAGFVEVQIKDEPGCYLCIAFKACNIN